MTKTSLYRHAAATSLHAKRQQNVRSALERIIEHAADVKVNGYCVVQACAAMARISAKGLMGLALGNHQHDQAL